jgi:CRISPR system Cascade subunit CasB
VSSETGFITWLSKFDRSESKGRAALAVLKRGVAKPPGEYKEMYPYVLPFFTNEESSNQEGFSWKQQCYFLTASLFAMNPGQNPDRTFAEAMYHIKSQKDSESIEKRFMTILSCRREDLPNHLRHAVSLLESKKISFDWEKFLRDIIWWSDFDTSSFRGSRTVQKKWAEEYWSKDFKAANVEKESSNQEIDKTNHEEVNLDED